jgi:hypothetical protein
MKQLDSADLDTSVRLGSVSWICGGSHLRGLACRGWPGLPGWSAGGRRNHVVGNPAAPMPYHGWMYAPGPITRRAALAVAPGRWQRPASW